MIEKIFLGGGVLAVIIAAIFSIFSEEIHNSLIKTKNSLNISYNQLIDERNIVSCQTDNVLINKIQPRNTSIFKKGDCTYVLFILSGFEKDNLGAVDIKLDAELKNNNNITVDFSKGITSITDPRDWVKDNSIKPVRQGIVSQYKLKTDGSIIVKIKGFVFDEEYFIDEFYKLLITVTDRKTGNSDSFSVPLYLSK